jgi:hypothetical protein
LKRRKFLSRKNESVIFRSRNKALPLSLLVEWKFLCLAIKNAFIFVSKAAYLSIKKDYWLLDIKIFALSTVQKAIYSQLSNLHIPSGLAESYVKSGVNLKDFLITEVKFSVCKIRGYVKLGVDCIIF